MQTQTETKTRDIYQEVTNDIIRDLEAGTIPWEKPWNGSGFAFPRNADSQNDYHGINVLILWCQQRRKQFSSSQWITYRQAQTLGAQVRRGEKATTIIYYKPLAIEETNNRGEMETRTIPMLRTHSVFNIAQCEGLEKLIEIENRPVDGGSSPEVCERAEGLVKASGATIQFDGGDMAFYDPTADSIHLPKVENFKDQTGYYGTVLHELTHWTGHGTRLAREFPKSLKESARAREELVAELGSSFLCAHAGLSYTTQHAAYIESWLSALKGDKTAIFKAAARAREASEFLLSKTAH